MKIMHFVLDSVCLYQFFMYIQRFLTIAVFLLAQDALRDLRYFCSTNNLRLVENFLEIIKEAFVAKKRKSRKSCILSWIQCVCINFSCIFNVFLTMGVFLPAQDALRDLRYFCSTNNLRLVENFLEIIKKLS